MTDGQKATIVLNYLEECDSTTILNVLDCLLSDEGLVLIYDNMKAEGIDLPNDGEDDA